MIRQSIKVSLAPFFLNSDRRFFITLMILALCSIQIVHGQDQKTRTFDIGRGRTITLIGNISGREERLEAMKLIYTKPDGFKEVPKSECFDDNPKLKVMLSCINNQLASEDEEFVVFYPLTRLLTESDSIGFNRMFPGSLPSLNGVHLAQMKHQIGQAYGTEAGKHWKDYVKYYSSAKAKTKFNADTAISYSVRLDSSAFYRGKYPYVGALLLQKKGLGYVIMHVFYTDKAKRNLRRYWHRLEGMLRYH